MSVVRGPLREKVPSGMREGSYKDEEERFDWQDKLPETRSRLRFLPLGFLPLGADRTVLRGARTNPETGTLATSFHRTSTILDEVLAPGNPSRTGVYVAPHELFPRWKSPVSSYHPGQDQRFVP